MIPSVLKFFCSVVLWILFTAAAVIAQVLPGSLTFSTSGSFSGGVARSSSSVLVYDNNLTNGYLWNFDLKDAPATLNPTGPAGSAAFQWGEGTGNSYPYPSALWFQPHNPGTVAPEQSFELGHLFFRNGTIQSTSGATWVDIVLTVAFAPTLGIDPANVVFGYELINTTNTSDPVASADIVKLGQHARHEMWMA